MVSDTTQEKSTPAFGEYFRKNIREYGLLIALVAIRTPSSSSWRSACC
jgi:ABC-type xylose transport system permease subunit